MVESLLVRWWRFYFSGDELLRCGECSEADRGVCICVCIHVWWDLLVDFLMLRLYLHPPHTHLILASSTVLAFTVKALHTAHHVSLPLVTWSLSQFSSLCWFIFMPPSLHFKAIWHLLFLSGRNQWAAREKQRPKPLWYNTADHNLINLCSLFVQTKPIKFSVKFMVGSPPLWRNTPKYWQ